MSEAKLCRDCGEEKDLDDFYASPCTFDRRMVYCKSCHKKRTARSVQKQRDRLKAAGMPQNAYRAPKGHNDQYLDRHLQRREEEAELEAMLEREKRELELLNGGMQLSSSPLNLNQIVSRIVFGPTPLKNFKSAWKASF